eukprot:jgi/Chrzof1/14428/Cz09g02160.t1
MQGPVSSQEVTQVSWSTKAKNWWDNLPLLTRFVSLLSIRSNTMEVCITPAPTQPPQYCCLSEPDSWASAG